MAEDIIPLNLFKDIEVKPDINFFPFSSKTIILYIYKIITIYEVFPA